MRSLEYRIDQVLDAGSFVDFRYEESMVFQTSGFQIQYDTDAGS